jgi:hypothetical protein
MLANEDSLIRTDFGLGKEMQFNSGTHEFFSPWNAYAGTGPNLLSGPVAPSCGYMKVKILFVKSSSNIFLSVKKILT